MIRFMLFAALAAAVFMGPQWVKSGKFSDGLQQMLKTGEFSDEEDDANSLLSNFNMTTFRGESPDGFEARDSTSPFPLNALPPLIERELLPLDQFLRFDVTPDWVIKNFPRVTVLPTIAGEGMRVALITGTRTNDLAGALTYYFDREQMVQRIALDCETGEPTAVRQFVQQHFQLKEVRDGVYVNQWNRVVISGMLVERARLIRQDQPKGNYTVRIELNRPGNYKRVSQAFHQRLQAASKPSGSLE